MSGMDRQGAGIDLDSLKRMANDLNLDGDPEVLLRAINLIGGRVAGLRWHAKRQIKRAAEGETP